MVTLLGPSGCGKTTTLRMIAGLIEPTAGRIYFDADDVTFLPPRKRNIGFVFQSPALFPHLSVADNVAFGLSVKSAKKDAIAAGWRRCDDGGPVLAMAKRLPASSRAVSSSGRPGPGPGHRPAVLFDEPLSALDRNLRDTLKYSILDLQRRTGKTAVYVTHDQSEAFAISDRIVVMNAGRVEQIGTQTDIYLQPQTRFVAEFIGANNGLEGKIEAVDGSGEDARATVRVGDLTLRAHAREGLVIGDAVIAYLRPRTSVSSTTARTAPGRTSWRASSIG
jgi:ABC-type Fe3+/spermidine/putrescine transport system ATPase subunit